MNYGCKWAELGCSHAFAQKYLAELYNNNLKCASTFRFRFLTATDALWDPKSPEIGDLLATEGFGSYVPFDPEVPKCTEIAD